MRRLNMIEGESATGGDRLGAGAALEPNPRQPQPNPGDAKPAKSFRSAGRSLTKRTAGQRRIQTTKRSSGNTRVWWRILRPVITGLPAPIPLSAPASSQTGSDVDSKPQGTNAIAQTGEQPGRNNDGRSGDAAGDTSDAGVLPDVSSAFRGEMAALLAFYATRIAAARRSLSPSDVAAVVQALVNEQVVAVRALMERWQAATRRQREETPQRPTGSMRCKDDPTPR
jgi:hypothetical protein